ncbi:MAG: inorganic diphosphatase [Pirellulales bacterium]
MTDKLDLRIDLTKVSPGKRLPQVANVIVEIPKGRRSKFEVDKETGLMKLDRYLYSSSHYPGDYGFIPQTLAEDGDALDALIMVNEATFPGCLIEARVVGIFRMTDRTKPDCKILGVPDSDPLFVEYRDLADVPSHFLKEVEHFFLTYKQLEGAEIQSDGWLDARAGGHEIESCRERWRAQQK